MRQFKLNQRCIFEKQRCRIIKIEDGKLHVQFAHRGVTLFTLDGKPVGDPKDFEDDELRPDPDGK